MTPTDPRVTHAGRDDALRDRAAVEDLVRRCAIAVDDRDRTALEACYADDAIWDTGRPGEVYRGRDAVIAWQLGRLADYAFTVHVPQSILVTPVGADRVDGLVVGHAEVGTGSGIVVTSFRYHDRYERRSGAWRLAVRRVETIYAMPAERYAGDGSAALVSWPPPDEG